MARMLKCAHRTVGLGPPSCNTAGCLPTSGGRPTGRAAAVSAHPSASMQRPRNQSATATHYIGSARAGRDDQAGDRHPISPERQSSSRFRSYSFRRASFSRSFRSSSVSLRAILSRPFSVKDVWSSASLPTPLAALPNKLKKPMVSSRFDGAQHSINSDRGQWVTQGGGSRATGGTGRHRSGVTLTGFFRVPKNFG